jgi:hypothetical protein
LFIGPGAGSVASNARNSVPARKNAQRCTGFGLIRVNLRNHQRDLREIKIACPRMRNRDNARELGYAKNSHFFMHAANRLKDRLVCSK